MRVPRGWWHWVGAGVLVLVTGETAAAAGLIDVNRASEAELAALPGIGPVLAQRVVQARQDRPFASWTDLQARVRGIGPKTAERLSVEGLRVEGHSYGAELARQSRR